MHYFMREPRNYRKMWILHFCPKDLCLRLSEFWSLKKKSVFSILPTPYTTCNNRGQNTLGDKWQQHIMVTDHSMCTGQATSCSNMSRRHVAATNRFVCTGELFWKSLTLKQNFVAAISRKKSNRLNLCDLLPAKTKICTWIHQHTRSDLSPRSVAPSKLSPDLYTRSDLSPRSVAATCRLMCSHLNAKAATRFLGALVLTLYAYPHNKSWGLYLGVKQSPRSIRREQCIPVIVQRTTKTILTQSILVRFHIFICETHVLVKTKEQMW